MFTTGHIGLNVTDLDTSAKFYERIFGFQVTAQTPGYAFLSQDGTLMLTLWQQSSGRFQTAAPGLHHLSFQVPDIEDVRRAEAAAREIGATIHHDGIVPHGEGAASGGLFFEDPDGTRLEIYAPNGAGERPAPSQDAPTCGFF